MIYEHKKIDRQRILQMLSLENLQLCYFNKLPKQQAFDSGTLVIEYKELMPCV